MLLNIDDIVINDKVSNGAVSIPPADVCFVCPFSGVSRWNGNMDQQETTKGTVT